MAWEDENAPDWCEIYKGVHSHVKGKWLIYPGTDDALTDEEATRLVTKIKPFLDLIEPINVNAALDMWNRWAFTKAEWEQLLEAGGD